MSSANILYGSLIKARTAARARRVVDDIAGRPVPASSRRHSRRPPFAPLDS